MATPNTISFDAVAAARARRTSDKRTLVGVARLEQAVYPEVAPYHPSSSYPEYPFPNCVSKEPNSVYEGVRRLFRILGLDANAFGTRKWNPLGQLIQPGMNVVIKPNWVLSRHKERKSVYSIITHPAVLRAVADYCWIALEGAGSITIADAPQYDCDFAELLEVTQLETVRQFYSNIAGPSFEVRDLRNYWSAGKHFASMLQPLPGDPKGSLRVNLGRASAFYEKPNLESVYGAVYNRGETRSHHAGDNHVYELSRTIFDADVVISVPKLKVHKKVGVTLNAKGLVGTATNKNLIIHYTLGSPRRGGDQYPEGVLSPMEERLIRTERWMYDHFLAPRIKPLEYLHRSIYWLHNNTTRRFGIKVAEEKRALDAGNWYGNDSAWRMTLDLLRMFYFADREGNLRSTPQRRIFSVIDGVIGGENCGPLTPDPRPAGLLIGGENALAVDLAATRLMGFDPLKLKMYAQALAHDECDFGVRALDDISICSDDPVMQSCLVEDCSGQSRFAPHPGWIGHIEI
ncbi:MAG: DUF362 domain-containing protein [Deltaproteobacteria bacterium]|nr:DUF362 domain-containing protein [Deltaproteobacteria bacterium]